MGKKLVIVESPAKANTIKKMLGKDYEITASYGHIRDLPKSKIGVDIENNFAPSYITIKGKGELIKKLKEQAKKSEKVYIASDPDREGEAIAWHIANILKLNDEENRIEFNEITKGAIQEAVKNPRKIDMNRVDAQQARRVLDRIVGYKISPLLWKIVTSNTSAGRVQSVALKIICNLEDSIKKFVSEKYWEVSGTFDDKLLLNIYKIENKKVDKIKDKTIVDEMEKNLKNKEFNVLSTKVTKKKQRPPFPLKTSTLQQLASSFLGFSASKTMKTAQILYEGVNVDGNYIGLITYMRTDSLRISNEAKDAAKRYIKMCYGDEYAGNYIPPKSKGKVQDAHEAIRPTDVLITPQKVEKFLNKDQYKLYKLIWERFLISQFSDMEYEQFEIIAEYDKYQFRGTNNKIIFEGYYKLYKDEEEIMTTDFPAIKENDKLKLKKLNIKEGETKPPARLSEASLVKKLESEGIGRPSTYAAIIDTLKKREYVKVEKKAFIPTQLGYEVTENLEKYFPEIMDIKFTAKMEDDLDKIEEGEEQWVGIMKSFYSKLEKSLESFEKEVKELTDKEIGTDIECSKCGSKMLFKGGRFGKYVECINEECKNKISLPKQFTASKEELEIGLVKVKEIIETVEQEKKGIPTDLKCRKCGGMIVVKNGRFGKYFDCENQGECKERFAIPKGVSIDTRDANGVILVKEVMEKIFKDEQEILDEAGKCEKCGSDFKVKIGRFGKFLACSNYPECKNIKKIRKKK